MTRRWQNGGRRSGSRVDSRGARCAGTGGVHHLRRRLRVDVDLAAAGAELGGRRRARRRHRVCLRRPRQLCRYRGMAKLSAYNATQTNVVWGQSPYVNITNHITFPVLPAADCDPDGDGHSNCVRVEVFRDSTNSNALPMLFGHLLGLSTQNIRATATALVFAANSSECLKPWAVADKWLEADGTLGPDRHLRSRGGRHLSVSGRVGAARSGHRLQSAAGHSERLRDGNHDQDRQPGRHHQPWLVPAARSELGAGCDVHQLRRQLLRGMPFTAARAGRGISAISCRRKTATWSARPTTAPRFWSTRISTRTGIRRTSGSSTAASAQPYTCSTPGLSISPRVVAIPIFDLELYLHTGGPGNGTVQIVNILGFFVDRFDHGTVTGYLINKKELVQVGAWRSGRPGVVPQANHVDSLNGRRERE